MSIRRWHGQWPESASFVGRRELRDGPRTYPMASCSNGNGRDRIWDIAWFSHGCLASVAVYDLHLPPARRYLLDHMCTYRPTGPSPSFLLGPTVRLACPSPWWELPNRPAAKAPFVQLQIHRFGHYSPPQRTDIAANWLQVPSIADCSAESRLSWIESRSNIFLKGFYLSTLRSI